jgi:hypothetical protein
MKTHLSNATWGVMDYAAYPIGMLTVARLSYAPIPPGLHIPLLRHLFRKPAVRGALPVLQPVGEER